MKATTISKVMSALGKRRSHKKTASSQRNGLLGGRPVEKNDPASILRRKRYAEKKNQTRDEIIVDKPNG